MSECEAGAREAQRQRGEGPRRYRSSGVGRMALKGYRAYGDMKAIARGLGAYSKRLIRRGPFRAMRKL